MFADVLRFGVIEDAHSVISHTAAFETIGPRFFDGFIDASNLIFRQFPTHCLCVVDDLFWTLGSTQGGRDALALNRPIDDDLSDRVAGLVGDVAELIDEVLILLPFLAVKHWIFASANLWDQIGDRV